MPVEALEPHSPPTDTPTMVRDVQNAAERVGWPWTVIELQAAEQ